MSKRSWFRVWYVGRLSRYAHSMATEWTSSADGKALGACGIDPYAEIASRGGDSSMMAFTPAGEDAERCAGCVAALEGTQEVAA